MVFKGKTQEYFEVMDVQHSTSFKEQAPDGLLSMIWFLDDNTECTIDDQTFSFNKNEIIFLTWLNKLQFKDRGHFKILRFNAPFYCILDHDSEVSCKGLLFYGSKSFTQVKLDEQHVDILSTVWKMLTIEMRSNDNLQLEMLQMMLKRILILCTRIYKSQSNMKSTKTETVDLLREFNFLVESHFKSIHSVSEYARLLNKSPKTLSNVFKKIHDKTPLQVIQNRIILEVKRLLRFTDKSISEIGYDVGFQDIQSFSRFFKKHVNLSPSEFRASF